MYPSSWTNTRDGTDLVNHAMVKNTKTWNISRTKLFHETKKFLTCLRLHILQSYRFAAEATFKEIKYFD